MSVVSNAEHFNAMQAMGQMSIFEVLGNTQQCFEKGDIVRVTITPESDWESYNYLESYCPVALIKPGEIVESLAKNQYLVSFKGDVQIFNAHEIEQK